MRLTIIVPLFNREPYIEAALLSLLRQRDVCEMEILVVNDGSTDNGPARVEKLASQCGHIRMIHTENQGVTKTRNVGLRHVPEDADFVSFLDSDDLSPSNRFRNDLPAFAADPALDFTYGKMTLFDELDEENIRPVDDTQQATVRGISVSASIFRAQFLRNLGWFDESLEQSEDTDFLFRAFEGNARYRLTDTIAVYYRQHPGNMTRQTKMARSSFMFAIHKSLARRKRNPSLRPPSGVFDLQELMPNRAG